MIGRIIADKYEILRVLQAGGMGVVCKAVHRATGKHVALKLIMNAEPTPREALGGTRDSQRELVVRFEREARAAGAIDTQHIVQVFDAGYDAECDMPFMVMELLAGEDVQQLIRRVGPVSPDAALRIIAQAAIGLTKAHDAGVVHRDIKPANLFLTNRENGDVVLKVLDFGIAKTRRDSANEKEATELTRTGSMLGSPQYMSPEQVHSDRSLDHRTDIWSLGIVLYKLLAGRSPHQEIGAMGSLLVAICTQPAPPIQDVAPWVPSDVAAIVHKALQIDRDDRFATMAEMLAAVRSLLADGSHLHRDMLTAIGEETRTLRAPRFQAAGEQTLMSSTSGPPSLTPIASTRRSPRTYGGIAALVAIFALGAFVVRPHAHGTEPRHDPLHLPDPRPKPVVDLDPMLRASLDSEAIPMVTAKLHVDAKVTEVHIDGQVYRADSGVVTFSSKPMTMHVLKIGSEAEKNLFVFSDGKVGDVMSSVAPLQGASGNGGGHGHGGGGGANTGGNGHVGDDKGRADPTDHAHAANALGFTNDFGDSPKAGAP